MTFVDTGALYAMAVASDANHAAARAWYASFSGTLVTTDHVVYELLTLLRMRGRNRLALEMGRRLFAGELAVIEPATPDDVDSAWQTFQDFDDKGWSFVDCLSRAVMLRLGVQEAFAFDAHFRQFGTVRVHP